MSSLMFETLSPTRLFFRCAVPSMIGTSAVALYSIADGIFVGRFIGQEALAAVNLAMPLVMIALALADIIATGSSVRVSMFLGQKENESANRTFTFCLKAILVISIVVAILGLLLAKPVLKLMGVQGDALLYGEEYICVFALFAPFIMPFFALDNYLRVCGKVKYSMVINVVTALLNILFDYLLIVVFKQGVWAAAFASCISMTVGTVWSLLPFLRKKLDLHFVKGSIPLGQFMKLIANGSSEFFSSIAGSIMMVIINVVLLALGGTTAVAAISVVMYVDSIVVMLIFGMVSALQPAISYCYGAGSMIRVKALQKRVMIAAAALSLTALVFMRCCGETIISLFVQPGNSALLEMSLIAMELYALSYLVSWIDGCLSGYLTALDRPGRSLIVSLAATLIFPCLCLAFMVPALELTGIWLMPLAAGILSAITAIIATATLKHDAA